MKKLLFILPLLIFSCNVLHQQPASISAIVMHTEAHGDRFIAQADTGISADVDTVADVVKDAVETKPKKGSPLNQWWVWASGIVLAGFGLFKYFKAKYRKKE